MSNEENTSNRTGGASSLLGIVLILFSGFIAFSSYTYFTMMVAYSYHNQNLPLSSDFIRMVFVATYFGFIGLPLSLGFHFILNDGKEAKIKSIHYLMLYIIAVILGSIYLAHTPL